MLRPLRIQYEGALYHVMSRGDRREMIFLDDADRRAFLNALAQACEKTGWQVHAFCLLGNHFHRAVGQAMGSAPTLCTPRNRSAANETDCEKLEPPPFAHPCAEQRPGNGRRRLPRHAR